VGVDFSWWCLLLCVGLCECLCCVCVFLVFVFQGESADLC